jgi:hypothetical protein
MGAPRWPGAGAAGTASAAGPATDPDPDPDPDPDANVALSRRTTNTLTKRRTMPGSVPPAGTPDKCAVPVCG